MAEVPSRSDPGFLGYAAMALLTAVFAWGVFFWYYALRALILGGACGARYGEDCDSGTVWNILIVVLLFPAICVSISVLNNGIYGPERRGHEFYRIVLATLPVIATADLALHFGGISFWLLVVVPCLALLTVVLVWTVRTIGLRGSFWLMRPERIAALGVDPQIRWLSAAQSSMFLLTSSLGAVSGFLLARISSGFIG